MSNYKKRRASPGNYSKPKGRKRSSGKQFIKIIAIGLAAAACISLVGGLFANRSEKPKVEQPTDPVTESNVTYLWAERTYQWPIDKTVADGKLTLTQTQGSATTSSNCTQLYLTTVEDDVTSVPAWTDYTLETNVKVASCETRTEFSLMGRLHTNEDGSFSYYDIKFRTDNNQVAVLKNTVSSGGSKDYKMVAMVDSVFTNDEFHKLRVKFTGNLIEIYVDDFSKPCLRYEDPEAYTSGTVGVDLARLGTAEVDYVKVYNSKHEIVFVDNFDDTRYFAADDSEATE